MNRYTFIVFCLVLAIGLSGCSRKKDKFINRSWHAITTEYNTLYNGEIALDLGKKQLADSYRDNFWQILPVERMQISDEITLGDANRNPSFQIAEEKATKAIQRHSMLIQGKEKNPQIDEAYLLLGKARYYDQRFIPALEAFNYILQSYPASNTISHAQIWREKTNLRLGNEQLAIKNLKRLIEANQMNARDNADAHAILAQAYINRNHLDSAAVAINIAAENTRDSEEEGRYRYIEGQLYNFLGIKDKAAFAFNQVIELNRRVPREYLVNAHLEKARNFNFSTGDPDQLLAWLQEMRDNRENRPFMDKINFQIAEYYLHLDSTNRAIEYYNITLDNATDDIFLRSVTYETLGNIYFDNSEYKIAGAYYDSTLTTIPTTTREYFVIKRKRDNLEEVIMYEDIADKNDSILRFVAMSGEERLNYFTNYAGELKASAIKMAQQGQITEITPPVPQRVGPGGPPSLGGPPSSGAPPALGGPSTGTMFYFYNPNRVAGGMADFLRIWGPRELKDNWRTDAGSIAAIRPEGIDEVSELIIANNPRYDPRTYIDRIPSDPGIIDSLSLQRDNAYFRLGLIYKEKFAENALAKQRLNRLLEFTTQESLIIPANYYLYQIYLEEGNIGESEKYKQVILRDYPASRYAANINNPGQSLDMQNTAGDKYLELYDLFEKEAFSALLSEGEIYLEKYRDDDLLPKIELLMAMARGRLYGYSAYRQALSSVALNYPQTEEGRKAQQLLNTALPQLANSEFTVDSLQSNIKLLYSFKIEEREAASQLKEKIENAIKEVGYRQYTASLDVYDVDTILIMVHGIENIPRAEGFAELLEINKSYNITRKPIVISSENYRIVQLHKNLGSYIDLKNNP